MRRPLFVVLVLLGGTTIVAASVPRATTLRRAWPLRAHVAGVGGGAARFRVAASGGAVLVTQVGATGRWWRAGGPVPLMAPLSAGDTLAGVAPAEFPVDVRRGALTFLAAGAESLEVVVTQNGGGALPVAARGRWIVVEDSAGAVRAHVR